MDTATSTPRVSTKSLRDHLKAALEVIMDEYNSISDKVDALDTTIQGERGCAGSNVVVSEASEDHPFNEAHSEPVTSKPQTTVNDVVQLNIGGKNVDIPRTALTQIPSRLAWMMNGRWDNCFPRDKVGRLFLDFDYEWIEPVFRYLRELVDREDGPSFEDPLSLAVGQMEIIWWLGFEFLLDGSWTPQSDEMASSPPSRKLRLDEVMGVFERAATAVDDLRKDFDAEIGFMTELKERLGHDDRQSLLYFNVGGTPFTVSKYTISQAPASKLWAHYCSGRWELQARELDQDGSIVLDMDPGCFGKIISCLRLAALAKDRGCGDIPTALHDSVVIESSQRRCFDRMMAYLHIDEGTVFDGMLERKTGSSLNKTVLRFSKQLTEWVGTSPRIWKLLYRGSRDGFSSSAFHDACDGRGSTVVVVQDTNNSVFGGYSSVSWLRRGVYRDSPGAFMFSLSLKGVLDPTAAKKCPFIRKSGDKPGPSTGCKGTDGPTWLGRGTFSRNHFIIRDNCNTSCSNNSFCLYTGKKEDYNGKNPYMLTGGDRNFVVEEIEVYACCGVSGCYGGLDCDKYHNTLKPV